MDSMDWVLGAYRKAGCTVAVDDFGSNYSNFNRIAMIRPDIVKIDRSLVLDMDKSRFSREVCKAIAVFADALGSQVLFEGIEEESQLTHSIDMCGCYLQGFLLGRPAPDFLGTEKNATQLLRRSFDNSQAKMDVQARNFHTVLRTLEQSLSPWPQMDQDALQDALCSLPAYCKRIYSCNRQGYFVTTTLERDASGAMVELVWPDSSTLYFRSFFLDCLHALDEKNKSSLSRPYRDIHTKKTTITFCYYSSAQHILFIDIDYNSILENCSSFFEAHTAAPSKTGAKGKTRGIPAQI
jgi:FOG: EAL domain